jgi:putative hemolysin
VVIDEFGGMSGIVTLEDLIEEIVGDIRDEHDLDEPIIDLGNGHHLVDASLPIMDINRHLGVELPEHDDYNSVGGLIVSQLGRVPSVGSKVTAFGLAFLVRDADARHVSLVEIYRSDPVRSSAA